MLLAFVSIAKKGFSNDTVMFNRIIDLTIYQTTELSVNYYFPENIDTKMKLVRRMNQSSITYNEYPFVFSWDYNSINSPKESYSKITLDETYLKVISPINLFRSKCCSDAIVLDSIAPMPPRESIIPFINKMMSEQPQLYKLYRLKLIYGISQIKQKTNNQQAESSVKSITKNPQKESLIWTVIRYLLIGIGIIGVFGLIILFLYKTRLNKGLMHELEKEKEKNNKLREDKFNLTKISNEPKRPIKEETTLIVNTSNPPLTQPTSSQKTEPKTRVILEEAYLSAPDNAGIFMVSNQRNSVIANESVFHIKQKSQNSNKYEFSIINDENIWIRALNYDDIFLDPVCDIDLNSELKGNRITVLEAGLLVKENGNYRTEEKIQIKIEG